LYVSIEPSSSDDDDNSGNGNDYSGSGGSGGNNYRRDRQRRAALAGRMRSEEERTAAHARDSSTYSDNDKKEVHHLSIGDHVKALVISVDVHSEKIYLSLNNSRLQGLTTRHTLGVCTAPRQRSAQHKPSAPSFSYPSSYASFSASYGSHAGTRRYSVPSSYSQYNSSKSSTQSTSGE
jgi:hypothetical protein